MNAISKSPTLSPRPEEGQVVYRLLDPQEHFLGFRHDTEVLVYCAHCHVFLLVKLSPRTERGSTSTT